ncbi:diphthamide biosynthesis protein 3-like protein [Dinothrombium tinctorium]|uniref:Diphthamide biosynthesis protein 3 n=1 Tax=Dinothrombium tinctorium TaxID=1965070 RepID=A0A3S3RPG3_9ACAR|nr:diphthamide biosynthesis protein 3-like protein [Dinothrombium tinctorium]
MADDGVIHDEIEIEDFEYDEENETFTYPCPCGDLFSITKEELLNGEEIARCPSCSLIIRVIYNPDELESVLSAKAKQSTSSLAIN